MQTPVIVWFRNDLRLSDHPALAAAVATQRPIVCLFVHDEDSAGMRPLGRASRWWLAQSLRALDGETRRRGGRLALRRGAAAAIVPAVAAQIGANSVFWNSRYDQPGIAVDRGVQDRLAAAGVTAQAYQANLLFEPDRLRTRAGTPFSVFTPFWRQARMLPAPRAPLPAPRKIIAGPSCPSENLDDWHFEPREPDWAGGLREAWTPGEAGARARAATFFDEILPGYAARRDRPDHDATSRLSPHLRFGEISPFQLWHAALAAGEDARGQQASTNDIEKYLSELGWREFSYHLLHHFPALAQRNVQPRFDGFAWLRESPDLAAWQRGRTGYPLVDAGMRQLWATGWMHNRVRMVAASFLVKHLLVDWRAGEAWFWDTLVDADPAANPASWQWVAGSGADAAPYFRVFNPMLQAEKFDPRGNYIRAWIPELTALSDAAVHAPWKAPADALARAGVTTGRTYPAPIVDHAVARARALAAYSRLREGRDQAE